ncbi:hypothetical protein LINGRAHAP2_LOCUS6378 [Linum grandiflorum]
MVDIREMEALCSIPKHIKKLLNDKYKVHHNMRQILFVTEWGERVKVCTIIRVFWYFN